MRKAAIQVHRWAGLAAGIYFLAIGLSGAILVFRPELQARAHPQFFAPRDPAAPLADPGVVIASIRARYAGHRFYGIDFPTDRRPTFLAYVARGDELETVFAEPASGAVIGALPREGWLYRLQEFHYNLLLGRPGIPLNGLGAASLVLMAITGLIAGIGRGGTRRLWELHRLTGIAASGWLIVLGTSGFYFAFPAEVRSLIGTMSPLSSPVAPDSRRPASPGAEPPSPAAIVDRARAAMPGAQIARYTTARSGTAPITVTVARRVHGDWDGSDEVTLFFDQYSGGLLAIREQTRRSAGDALFAWMGPLHMATFGGWPLKIVWSLAGLALPLLFITGATLWSKHLAPRRSQRS